MQWPCIPRRLNHRWKKWFFWCLSIYLGRSSSSLGSFDRLGNRIGFESGARRKRISHPHTTAADERARQQNESRGLFRFPEANFKIGSKMVKFCWNFKFILNANFHLNLIFAFFFRNYFSLTEWSGLVFTCMNHATKLNYLVHQSVDHHMTKVD